MIEKVIKITNRAGIHARPSSLIVELTKDFKSSIYFEHNGNRIDAKSILGIIMLGACYNSELKIIADGEDEREAVDRLTRLFASKFDEEDEDKN